MRIENTPEISEIRLVTRAGFEDFRPFLSATPFERTWAIEEAVNVSRRIFLASQKLDPEMGNSWRYLLETIGHFGRTDTRRKPHGPIDTFKVFLAESLGFKAEDLSKISARFHDIHIVLTGEVSSINELRIFRARRSNSSGRVAPGSQFPGARGLRRSITS